MSGDALIPPLDVSLELGELFLHARETQASDARHAEHALLIDGLDGNEVHARARGRFTHRRGIVGVVLSCLTVDMG